MGISVSQKQINALKPFGVYGYNSRRALERGLQQKQYEAQEARKQTAADSKKAAEERAAAMLEAAGYSQKTAKERAALQTANLAESQARTQAATDSAQAKLDPWYEAGTDALGKLQAKIEAGPGDMKKSPGYQFRLDEGNKAIERSAAAKGGALSGAAVKASLKYGQDYATNDYDNFLRRYYESMEPLQQLSGQGMQAGTQQGVFGMQGASDMAQQGQTGTNAIGEAMQYGADTYASGMTQSANILADQKEAQAQRDYGYAAFKAGEDF